MFQGTSVGLGSSGKHKRVNDRTESRVIVTVVYFFFYENAHKKQLTNENNFYILETNYLILYDHNTSCRISPGLFSVVCQWKYYFSFLIFTNKTQSD